MKRAAWRFAFAALSAFAANAVLPAMAVSALRSVLVALPFVVALAATLRQWIGGSSPRLVERLLAGGWLAVALHADRLPLAHADRLLFVALVLLVVARLFALFPALRRFVRQPGARRALPVALFVLIPGLVLAPWINATSRPNGDEPYYLLLAASVASDGDLDLRDEYRDGTAEAIAGLSLAPQPGDPVGAGGERLSRHGALFPIALAPFWKVGGVLGSRLLNLLLWALLAGQMARLATLFEVPSRAALLAALLAALGAPLVLYAASIWIEVPAALAVAVALTGWAEGRRSASGLRGAALLRFSLALVALPLLKLRFLALAIPLAALAILDRRNSRRPRRILAAAILGSALAILFVNWWTTGNPLRIYRWRGLLGSTVSPAVLPVTASGLLFDLAFGLATVAPLWALALAELPRLARRSRDFALATAAHLPYFALVASRREWFGGWAPPFRYGIVLVPLLCIALAEHLARAASRRLELTRWVLSLASALVALALIAEPGWATSLADGRARWVDLAAAPFHADFARFLPSAVRPRTASWLAPIVLLIAALPTWRRPTRRLRELVPLAATGVAVVWIAWIVAAHTVPTRRAELEDPWITKRGGSLFPERWTFDRTRFEGGWRLDQGVRARIDAVRGGGSARVRVRWRLTNRSPVAGRLRVSLGRSTLATLPLEPAPGWNETSVDVERWPRGAPLELRLLRAAPGSSGSSILIDRVDFDWR